jgi:hypothetical protein
MTVRLNKRVNGNIILLIDYMRGRSKRRNTTATTHDDTLNRPTSRQEK